MLHLHLLGQEKKIPKFTFSNNFWCFHPKIHSVPSAFLCVTSSSWSAQKTEIPVLFLDPAGSQNLFFFNDRRQHTRMCVTFSVLSPMGCIAEGLKDTTATGKTTTSSCCLPWHLIKTLKERKRWCRQIPNESQNEAQNTPKEREDGSENFKANPGIFSHTFYKV